MRSSFPAQYEPSSCSAFVRVKRCMSWAYQVQERKVAQRSGLKIKIRDTELFGL